MKASVGWSFKTLFERRRATRGSRWSGGSPLIGYFEVRVDRVVGWAKVEYGASADSMVIEFVRRGAIIASCPATSQPAHNRFVFNIPIEERFTTKELALDHVAVVARDSDGNRGILRLDGAAQIEFLRELHTTPADIVLDLDFSHDGNARPYLLEGWYGAEADFTWTANDESFVAFDAPSKPGTYALRLTAGANIHESILPEQKLGIFVNQNQIAEWLYKYRHVQFNECRFSYDVFTSSGRAMLQFYHPNAARPSDIGDSPDGRRLAFNVKRLTIARLAPPE